MLNTIFLYCLKEMLYYLYKTRLALFVSMFFRLDLPSLELVIKIFLGLMSMK